MPANKNQHYVPQFYLRFFSNSQDQKTIGIWNIEKEQYIKSGTIKNQASSDYFYGKGSELEKIFSNQEGVMAQMMQHLMINEKPFSELSTAHIEFLTFIFLLIGRTRYAAEKINEMTDKMAKKILKYHPEFKDKLDSFYIKSSNAPVEAIDHIITAFPVALDLRFKLVINKSDIPFILSDNPIVLHNQHLQNKKWPGGHTGFAQIGLQIFFPMSPHHMLIFYDRNTYKIGNKKDSTIHLTKDQDAHLLNQIQLINADKVLFFNNELSEVYFKKLSNEIKTIRNSDKIELREFKKVGDPKNSSSLLALSNPHKNIDLKLSFIKELKKAKKRQIGPSMCNVRNNQLVEECEKFRKKVREDRKKLLKKRHWLINFLNKLYFRIINRKG